MYLHWGSYRYVWNCFNMGTFSTTGMVMSSSTVSRALSTRYSTGQNKLYVIYYGVAVERWILITVRYYTRSPIGLYGYAVIFAIIGRRNNGVIVVFNERNFGIGARSTPPRNRRRA